MTMPMASLVPDATLSIEKLKIDATSGDLCPFDHYVFLGVFQGQFKDMKNDYP